MSSSRLFAGLERMLLFVFSLAIAYAFGTWLLLHTGNPYGVENVNNIGYGWNPETNYLQVIATVLVSAVVFLGLSLLRARGLDWAVRIVITAFSAMAVFSLKVLPVATRGAFDPFHYGEQLSPSAAFLSGRVPFTDIFVLHGAGEDIFKPALGYILFNGGTPSIGSYLMISALLEGAAVLAFFIVIALMIKPRWLYLAIALWLTITAFSGFTYSKNITVLVFVVILWILATRPWLRGRTRLILLAVAGFIASIVILDSIDVGALMGAVSAGLAVLLVFITPVPEGLRLGRPRWRNLLPGIALTVGVIVGQLVTLVILGGHAYVEFLKATFIDIPRYQGLMWGQPLPLMSNDQFITWVPIFAMAATIPLIWSLLRRDHLAHRFTFAPQTVFAVTLFAFAIIYTRYAIGRPDGGHIVMAAPFMLLATFYAMQLAVRDLEVPLKPITRRAALWPVALIGAVLVFAPGAVVPATLFVNGAPVDKQLRELKNLAHRTDDSWLTQQQRDIRDFVQQHTAADDSIFVFQPDPSYYFLTDRRNPTRFAISWFMDPEPFTQEALADLKADPPALVLYDTKSPYADSDGIPIAQRFPEIDTWIQENYPVQIQVGDAIIRAKQSIPGTTEVTDAELQAIAEADSQDGATPTPTPTP